MDGGGGTYDCGINKNFSELRENGVCLSLFTIIIQIEPEDYTQWQYERHSGVYVYNNIIITDCVNSAIVLERINSRILRATITRSPNTNDNNLFRKEKKKWKTAIFSAFYYSVDGGQQKNSTYNEIVSFSTYFYIFQFPNTTAAAATNVKTNFNTRIFFFFFFKRRGNHIL